MALFCRLGPGGGREASLTFFLVLSATFEPLPQNAAPLLGPKAKELEKRGVKGTRSDSSPGSVPVDFAVTYSPHLLKAFIFCVSTLHLSEEVNSHDTLTTPRPDPENELFQ